MKKNIFFFILILFVQENLFSQKKGVVYSLDIDKWFCNVSLYNSGEYDVYLSQNMTNDIVYSLHLSHGSFFWEANLLTLHDKVNQFHATFLYKNKKIVPQQNFKFLLGKVLSVDISSYLDEKSLEPIPFSYINAKKERLKYQNDHKEKYLLFSGSYYSADGFLLNLKKEHVFLLSYKLNSNTLLLSSGTWQRKGNELVLFDTSLKSYFYLLINKNKSLVSKYILGDYYGVLLKKM